MLSIDELALDTGAKVAEKWFMNGAKLVHDQRTDRAMMWRGPQSAREVHRVRSSKLTDIHRWMSRHPGYRCKWIFCRDVRVYWVDLEAEARYNEVMKGGEHGDGRESEC